MKLVLTDEQMLDDVSGVDAPSGGGMTSTPKLIIYFFNSFNTYSL